MFRRGGMKVGYATFAPGIVESDPNQFSKIGTDQIAWAFGAAGVPCDGGEASIRLCAAGVMACLRPVPAPVP
jgi:hypothetical protein